MKSFIQKLNAFIERYGAWLIFGLALVISIVATAYFFTHGDEILGYKDSLSRLNIARGVTHSRTPGLVQLGTIWLPLYQFLLIPFAANDFLWRTGLAGSIVSGIGYIIASMYIYKVGKLVTGKAWLGIGGAFLFMLNPNILYMQSIAMTEVLLCATLAGAFYHLLHWVKNDNLLDLIFSAAWVAAASLDRYEGWLAAVACTFVVAFEYLVVRRKPKEAEGYAVLYAALAFFGIALWFMWNLVFWGGLQYVLGGSNFSQDASQHLHIGQFLQAIIGAMRQNIGPLLLAALPLSLLIIFAKNRKLAAYAIGLPLVPMMFVALSLAHGLPLVASNNARQAYDLRYGISAIVVAAVAAPIVIGAVPKKFSAVKISLVLAAITLSVLAQPYAYETGAKGWNNGGEILSTTDKSFAQQFKRRYRGGNILMANGGSTLNPDKHLIGVDLSNYIWEGNGKIWDAALQDPVAEHIRYVVMNSDANNQDFVYANYLTHQNVYDKNYTTVLTAGKYRVLEAKNFVQNVQPNEN